MDDLHLKSHLMSRSPKFILARNYTNGTDNTQINDLIRKIRAIRGQLFIFPLRFGKSSVEN